MPVILLFCDDEHRPKLDEAAEYWFGLYKLTATENGATAWYDGNPSTYRDWKSGDPNKNHICILYSNKGFNDRNCDKKRYYTCKKSSASDLRR